MTDAELIARLRDEHISVTGRAADRIKALIAERDEAEAKLAKAVEALDCIAHGGAYTDMQIARTTLAEIKSHSDEFATQKG